MVRGVRARTSPSPASVAGTGKKGNHRCLPAQQSSKRGTKAKPAKKSLGEVPESLIQRLWSTLPGRTARCPPQPAGDNGAYLNPNRINREDLRY